jgi:hypothetical protein
VDPKSWDLASASIGNPYKTIADLVNALVLLTWGLLIARLIHGEVLVGDRQFWITRPYEWPKLLAAKALFVALLLYLPFLLMEVAILLQAGFNPLSYIPGLLYRLLLISLVFFPLIALAAITSDLVRMLLTVLGVYVAFAALMSLTFFFSSSGSLLREQRTYDVQVRSVWGACCNCGDSSALRRGDRGAIRPKARSGGVTAVGKYAFRRPTCLFDSYSERACGRGLSSCSANRPFGHADNSFRAG